MAKFNNEVEMFFVYDENPSHTPRITDKEHLELCIKSYKQQIESECVYVSRAVMCFSGYLVKGEYVGKY